MKKQYVTPEMEEFKYDAPLICYNETEGGSSSTKQGEGGQPI